VPERVYEQAVDCPRATGVEYFEVGFERGLPVSLNGDTCGGVELIERLGDICRRHRAGFGIHIGDTVLGIKGRIAFEAGAAQVCIHSHRELEKITTTAWQRFWKDHMAEFYGKLLHEGNAFDPVLRDIEAMIDSSQERVTGRARVRLGDGKFDVVGVDSPFSLLRSASGVYGETPKLWTGEDVRGFSTITSVPSKLHRQAAATKGEEEEG
jgi:argininosuccinate synthase